MKKIFLSLLLFFSVLNANVIKPDEAINHINEYATVCGKVVSSFYSKSINGQPTFINLDKSYPNQVFTIVIWGNYRDNFNVPEKQYNSKNICVTGKIGSFRNKAQMVVTSPNQIKIK